MKCRRPWCKTTPGTADSLPAWMWRSFRTRTAVNARRAGGDDRMPANSTKRSVWQRDGALAEFIVMPREKLYTARLSPKELCLVEPLTVGFHAASRGRISAEDTVAIIGCGGVGLGAVAASSSRGARTICIDVDDEKLELARSAGGTDTINSSRESLHHRLLELTEGHGPDVVIEAVGTAATFRAAVEEVSFTGRVVYIGYPKEPVSYETKLFVQKELDVLGSRNA